jgi:hypothetical protein
MMATQWSNTCPIIARSRVWVQPLVPLAMEKYKNLHFLLEKDTARVTRTIWCQVASSICYLVKYHFTYLFFRQLPIVFITISSICHFINLPFHQLAISSTCHFTNLPFHQRTILPITYELTWPFLIELSILRLTFITSLNPQTSS